MLKKDIIEAILFDLDGTLMDTDDQAVEKLALWLKRLGWPRPRRAARRILMLSETPGNAMLTILDVVGLDGPLMRVTDWLHRQRGLHTRDDFCIMPGAKEMLIDLKQRYRLAVVTTRGVGDAEAFLVQHELDTLFEAMMTRESTWRLKPHPKPILQAAQSLAVPPERCLMVGDTTVDVKSARGAGAQAVAVLCGFGEREELEQAGAHIVLDHTSHLSALLR
jgi:HAD superfamily hydrolase (TIGR01549 family)